MKFDVDYTDLDKDLSQPRAYKYADVKDHLVKVAFDIVRFKDPTDIDGLWQIRQTDDGEIIFATYEDGSTEVNKESSWDSLSNKTGTSVTVFYKNSPVTKVATASNGIPSKEAHLVCEYLPEKLAMNGDLRKSLFNELSNDERQELFTKFPELNE